MLKRYAIAFSIAVLGVGAVLFYFWQRATQLPSWYVEQQSAAPDASEPVAAPDRMNPAQPTIPASLPPSTASNQTSSATTPSIQKQKAVREKIVSRVQEAPPGKRGGSTTGSTGNQYFVYF
ncbi:hypothetical protein K9N68_07145 [Kovacikia minuta CCNUW1]|uniref:hypothetical protein n=1 Tax=Kovacikia minuta TaxID=2931930 RepID=UPI001CCCE621|nr:hypothetical protein [Kovacikia minuta]UBF27685.1 hypothetical protein K9N68_07145 [Kovacikia minuta CCNUW1]